MNLYYIILLLLNIIKKKIPLTVNMQDYYPDELK